MLLKGLCLFSFSSLHTLIALSKFNPFAPEFYPQKHQLLSEAVFYRTFLVKKRSKMWFAIAFAFNLGVMTNLKLH